MVRNPRRGKPISELTRWRRSLKKLTEWRTRVEKMDTMQGEKWRTGQLRHIDKLLTAHRAAKPRT